MNEAQVNETQADDGVDEETLASGNGDVDAEKLRRLRLTGFLRELVREEGRVEAAELLGVAYRTVVRAEESGEITGRMGDALERLLGTGDDPEGARLRERVDALEGGVEAMAKELRDGLGVGVAPEEACHRAASGPGGRDRGGCRRRRGGLRSGVAADRGVAQAAGRASPPGEESVVAHDGGAAADAGAGDAGRPRADAAPGDPGPAGLRAQGTDHPSLEGAGRHTGGVAEAEAAALGAPGPHPVAVAEVGPGDGSGAGFRLLLHRSEMGANSARVIWVELAQNPLRSLPFARLFGR